MRIHLCAIVLLFTIWTSAAFAQTGGADNLELSISESISVYTKKNFQIGSPQSSTPIDGSMQLRSKNRHEFRFNFLTKGRFGSELFYSYQSTKVDFKRSTPPTDTLSVPLQVHQFGVNLLYYPLRTESSKWKPFLNIGGGAMIYRPTSEGQQIATDPLRGNLPDFFESSRAAFNYGAGIKRDISRSFGVRFDVGNITTATPTFGLPAESTDSNGAVLPIKGRTNNSYASIGIILHLGR